jgi:hypothetical protein
MSQEAKDLARQFVVYADAITAFSVAQAIAVIYAMAHGDCFTLNVLEKPWVPMLISLAVSAGYLLLVYLCHKAENRLLGPPSARDALLGRFVMNTHRIRYVVGIVACVATPLVIAALAYAKIHCKLHFDCAH